ncbi:hypothetical protein JTB14_009464 [Gonioctena quinquepunctata]|nr:hypothetical protein JTB14_009464 [Gonioctena quinquepunctata]
MIISTPDSECLDNSFKETGLLITPEIKTPTQDSNDPFFGMHYYLINILLQFGYDYHTEASSANIVGERVQNTSFTYAIKSREGLQSLGVPYCTCDRSIL